MPPHEALAQDAQGYRFSNTLRRHPYAVTSGFRTNDRESRHGNSKADAAATVAWKVVATARHTSVPLSIVPRAAAHHAEIIAH